MYTTMDTLGTHIMDTMDITITTGEDIMTLSTALIIGEVESV